MLDGALTSGLIDARATFEVFTRSLPNGFRYGVVAGTGQLIDELASFRFDESSLEWLLAQGIVSPALGAYLAAYRFDGDIVGYLEGELFTSLSPVLRVEGRFADIVLETLALSILNFDSGVATKAMRVVRAARGRRLIEMGSRRTNERAAVAAARASYIAGFDATSNLAAGMLYDIPTAGTAAHAFILAHESERDAFEAQVATQGPATTLLVDTFDTETGTELAFDVAGPDLGAIRIDSGVIADAALRSRKLLDQRGGTNVKITLTGDLDEFAIADLLARDIPVDAFGVGTKLVSGYTPPGFVYKLVAIESGSMMRSVAKRSIGKLSTMWGEDGVPALRRRRGRDRTDDASRERWTDTSEQPTSRARTRSQRCLRRRHLGAHGTCPGHERGERTPRRGIHSGRRRTGTCLTPVISEIEA